MMYKLTVLPQWTTSAISRWRETRFVYLAKMEASHGQKGRQIVAKRLPLLCIGKMEIEAEHGERERIAARLPQRNALCASSQDFGKMEIGTLHG